MLVKKQISSRSAAQARAAQVSARRQESLARLGTLDCLRGIPPTELTHLLELSVFRTFQAGDTVFGQQRESRFVFFVIRGALQLRLRDKNGREVLMGVLGTGDCFGEGPLFGDYFRRMSALAQNDCQLLQVPLAPFRESLSSMPLLATGLRQIYKRRLVDCTLARVPLLGRLSPLERATLAGQLQPLHIDRGHVIMRQGEPADALYLIESGQVVVEQGSQPIAGLSEGDFFGEMALLTSQPHRANVRALTPTDILALPGAAFQRLIEERPDLEAQLRMVVEQRIRNTAAVNDDAVLARQLELAVSRGVLRAPHLLVRQPALCPPGCRICEEACTQRHGRSRISLNGTLIEQFDVVDGCRQCSVGAECVEACPEDAFERTDDGVLLITDRCTGCGDCVAACPYDAVATVPRQPANGTMDPLRNLLRRAGARLRREVIPLQPAQPTHRADKCDHCAGFADKACVARCPTGSMRLIPIEEIFPV